MKFTLSDFAALGLAAQGALAAGDPAWGLKQMKSLVTFGDSYTDESRYTYFEKSGGKSPPVGWIAPETSDTSTGGRIWPRYVNQYSGANIFNYAVSGAVCSGELNPRKWESTDLDYPSVHSYEVPAFINDSKYKNPKTNRPALDVKSDSTVYSIWIGTNDLGLGRFLSDSQVAGKTLEDYVDCVFDSLKAVYDNGGRYFVLMNLIPLNLTPNYVPPEDGGPEATPSWSDKPQYNSTEIQARLEEHVVLLNSIYNYRTSSDVEAEGRFPGAHFAVYDTHSLFSDMYANPSQFLNGTEEANVLGWIHQCDLSGENCKLAKSPDSYMWYDQIHPSEQTTRHVASNFMDVVKGTSKYASYFSG